MIGLLPKKLTVNGREYAIRTDYRDILKIIVALNDVELTSEEKLLVCLVILYEDFETIPAEDLKEAYGQAVWFIDLGEEPEEKRNPHIVDWEQDERIMFPAINNVAGYEVRAVEYLHWWTFMGYFMEIHDGTFSQVVSLRNKKAKGKKLEKWEREFWSSNKNLCVIRKKLSQEEREKKEKLMKMLDG